MPFSDSKQRGLLEISAAPMTAGLREAGGQRRSGQADTVTRFRAATTEPPRRNYEGQPDRQGGTKLLAFVQTPAE